MNKNRFVVECSESYDQYRVDVPHPIETELTREDLLAELRSFFDEIIMCRDYKSHILDLGGTGLMIYDCEITCINNREYYPPRIMTVDEWFAAATPQRGQV